jgi:hypothetical protein
MRTYNVTPQQRTIHAAILSTFTAEGLTRQEALTQPRRAEVILRHDPFAASPYIVALSSPAFAFEESGAAMRRDHIWDFATFNEARAWFDELFDANSDMIAVRQQPQEREKTNGTKPWRVGDAAILSRLIPYDIWLARTRFRFEPVPAPDSAPASDSIEEGESFFSYGN